MNKIPVGRTIASAYSFTFGHIGVVIGLIWLPLVIFFVGNFFVMNYYVQGMEAWFADKNPAEFGRPFLALMGFYLAAMFLIAVVGVAITKQAMGLRTGGAIVHFGLGAAELNLFLSFVAAYLVTIAVCVAVAIATSVVVAIGAITIGAISPALMKSQQAWGVAGFEAFVVVALVASLLIIAARLVFLLSAVTVAEGKIDLIRAWTLSRGNFWRIVLIGIATVVPIMAVMVGAEIAILGPQYFVPNLQPSTDVNAQMAQMAAQMRLFSTNMPMLLGLGLLLAPFNYGLLFAAPAFAYRAIVSPPASAVPPPDTGPLRPA